MHLHTALLGLVSEARPDKGGRRTDSCVSRLCVSLVLLAFMSTTAVAVADVVSTSTGHEGRGPGRGRGRRRRSDGDLRVRSPSTG